MSSVAVAVLGCSRPEEDFGLVGVRPYKYGDASSQIGELSVPNKLGPHPVVVLLHGGWWRVEDFDRRAMRALAKDLVKRGFAAWNLEYRLVGEQGGGWPGTFEDVARGIDALDEHAGTENLDLDRVAVVGHSSGGHLALWSAKRGDFPAEAPGSAPLVVPKVAVALNAICDLVEAARQGLGGDAVADLMGGTPEEVPERYALSDPVQLVPMPIPVRLYHAKADPIVPIEQSRSFQEAARRAGSEIELVELSDATHFDVIDPSHASWQAVAEFVQSKLT